MYNGTISVNNLDENEIWELLEACNELHFDELIKDLQKLLIDEEKGLPHSEKEGDDNNNNNNNDDNVDNNDDNQSSALPLALDGDDSNNNSNDNNYTCSPNWFCDFNGQNYSNFDGRK